MRSNKKKRYNGLQLNFLKSSIITYASIPCGNTHEETTEMSALKWV